MPIESQRLDPSGRLPVAASVWPLACVLKSKASARCRLKRTQARNMRLVQQQRRRAILALVTLAQVHGDTSCEDDTTFEMQSEGGVRWPSPTDPGFFEGRLWR